MAAKRPRQRPAERDERDALLDELTLVLAADRERRLTIVTADGTDPTPWRATMEDDDARRLERFATLSVEQLREELWERELALHADRSRDAAEVGQHKQQHEAGIKRLAQRKTKKQEDMIRAVIRACDIVARWGLIPIDPPAKGWAPYNLSLKLIPRPTSKPWRDLSTFDRDNLQGSYGSFDTVYTTLIATWTAIKKVEASPKSWDHAHRNNQCEARATKWLVDAELIKPTTV